MLNWSHDSFFSLSLKSKLNYIKLLRIVLTSFFWTTSSGDLAVTLTTLVVFILSVSILREGGRYLVSITFLLTIASSGGSEGL
jgi:hypothetical protein